MNTANLQLEGIYVILAAILGAMCEKGVFKREEIDALLSKVEAALSEDPNRPEEMRGSNVEAICFPARFLRQAIHGSSAEPSLSFADIAMRVGQMKREAQNR
ncbi:hypothetical protein MJC1_00399 [Methylocystis sp. MJC1]|jgi:hypothetical protein|uniref:hypothetical protein n=1 Tax=Methylocystis sp. MJC1 TaxID=2654282 RepID=UPI001C1DF55D|nr:hypothetical protein [Methylocystis sp. MJC1]KAF2992819.1 hypothetical protein MJC1_00399 [Methylocystis sp. MJC1]